MRRRVWVEERADCLAVGVDWMDGEIAVAREAYPLPLETGPLVYTTQGHLPIGDLARTLNMQDTPNEIAVAVEWRYNGELVRRDAHVVLKEPSVVAAALAAQI